MTRHLAPLATIALAVAIGSLAALCLVALVQAADAKNATRELVVCKHHLDAAQMQDAYDDLLAAMRVAPGDERVFETSLDFVRKAAQSGNGDAIFLAQDVHQRAANLIPFLPLARLQSARAAHTQAGEELFPAGKAGHPEDPLAEAEVLLNAAQQNQLPTFARTRLLHDVEAELSSQARRVASTSMKSEDQRAFWDRWNEIKGRYDAAQKQLSEVVYAEELKQRLTEWQKKADAAQKDLAEFDDWEKTHQADNSSLLSLVIEGQQIRRDMTPFVEGGIEAAKKDSEQHERDLTRLARFREWNFNRWVLAHLDNISHRKDLSKFAKLQSLAGIDEIRLAPFVAEEFSKAWKDLFDGCNKDEKVEATKARILREYQP
jgi:hypothetical protein